MRLWTVHPKYLDTKGLVALWREALLAQKVLQGKTRGWRNHPQLERFKQHPDPVSAICYYLYHVQKEGKRRGYDFKKEKILRRVRRTKRIEVNEKFVEKEISDLKKKLKKRAVREYKALLKAVERDVKLHPLFKR